MNGGVPRMAARDQVNLRDGATLKGRIGMTADENLSLTTQNGAPTVSYAEVAEMKKRSSFPIKSLLILGAAVGVVGLLTWLNSD